MVKEEDKRVVEAYKKGLGEVRNTSFDGRKNIICSNK
jgi:hypothetical protein